MTLRVRPGYPLVRASTYQVCTGTHPELVEDPSEVGLDGLHAHEQGVGDFAVRLAFGDEGGDAHLGRRQLGGGVVLADEKMYARKRDRAVPSPQVRKLA